MAVVIRTEIEIDAPIDVVWHVLTDLARYPEWNPFTVQMDSSLKLGAPVRMRVAMRENWKLRQTEYVSAYEVQRKLCWKMKTLPAFVLGAERCQHLQALEGQRTHYVNADEFRGLLTPLVMMIFGRDVERGFQGVAEALKHRAEQVQAESNRGGGRAVG